MYYSAGVLFHAPSELCPLFKRTHVSGELAYSLHTNPTAAEVILVWHCLQHTA
jgi:hypothetical protein